MSRWNRKQLVLDASIAMGSNDKMYNPAGDVAGDRNRACLQAIREEEHLAVFNEQLRLEWREHASRFSITWLQQMTQKNRVIAEEGESFSVLLTNVCACQPSAGLSGAIEKDFHLIRSALATDQIIISNETVFPRCVATACDSVHDLLQLHYGSPALEGEACRLWIKAGAQKDTERRIDTWAAAH